MANSNQNIIKPQEGGQWDFFTRSEFEVLFGGQAGPGKSWGLVIDALGLQFKNTKLGCAAIEIPDYRAALFRRKTTQFTKLIDEARKYYIFPPFEAEFIHHRVGDPGPSFNFPIVNRPEVSGPYYSGRAQGARIFVCHMEQEINKEDHQGQEYQYAGFDEVTQFTITQYLYIFSRTRSTIPNLPPRIRATANPTGISLRHFKKRFIRNGQFSMEPGKTYFFKHDYETEPEQNPMGIVSTAEDPEALSRCFIPGKLDENIILIKNDPSYKNRIRAMGKKYGKALLEGDWDAFSGDFFDDFHSDMLEEPFEIPDTWPLSGSIDPGWSAPCSFSLRTRDLDGRVYRILTYYVSNQSPSQHAKAIKGIIESCPYTKGRMPEYIVSGLDAFAHKDRYAIDAHELTFADVFLSYGLELTPANTNRHNGWWAIKELMRSDRYRAFKGMNEMWLDELIAAEHDEKDIEDIKGRGNDPTVADHALDEDRYGVLSIYTPIQKEESTPPPEVDPYHGTPIVKGIRQWWE